MFVWGFILLGSLAWLGHAHPLHSDADPQWLVRERRSPTAAARTMILIRGQPASGGYNYERPERAFNPQAAAYATGGIMAARAYHGAPSRHQELVDEDPTAASPEQAPKSAEEQAPQESPAAVDVSKTPLVPERKAKAPKAPKRRPSEDEDEDDEDEDVAPRKGGRPGGSVYRNFFPMTFAGATRSRARNAEDGDGEGDGGSGVVTAIANSFSKGRGAIASSSAVAHGNPDAGQKRQRNQKQNRARAPVHQPEE